MARRRDAVAGRPPSGAFSGGILRLAGARRIRSVAPSGAAAASGAQAGFRSHAATAHEAAPRMARRAELLPGAELPSHPHGRVVPLAASGRFFRAIRSMSDEHRRAASATPTLPRLHRVVATAG